MAQTNRQLARIFQQMADVSEILGSNRFRVVAYQRAARALEEITDDVSQLDPKQLQAIEGIGSGMAQRIGEYLDTGTIAEHEQLRAEVPPGLVELLDIPNLGPKSLATLWQQGGVTDKASLRAKLVTGELEDLPRMGKKTLEKIQHNLDYAEQASQRARIGKALPIATWFLEQLRQIEHVRQARYAGSLRRGKETIGDIDLLVSADPTYAGDIANAFVKLEPVEDVLLKGQTKTSVRLRADVAPIQVDLRIIEPAAYGAAMLYFTGSKDHNVRLRERAIRMGCKLSEYGLFDAESDERLAGETEVEVYNKLELAWIAPELREDRGEITIAQRAYSAGHADDAFPDLLELSHIQAELHAHTTASDGVWSIAELAEAAAERGFHTIAVTDHSKSQIQAHGLKEDRLAEHIENIRTTAAKMQGTINILAGSEVDILFDGRLDYPNKLLAQLDIVVASPHAALSQDSTKATQRLLKAIKNPYVTILGHPTGRIVNRRQGIAPDMKKVVAAAAQRGIALEINANHHRLDLRDSHARLALEAGAKLAINTDAHGPADLDQLIFGIMTARRAGAKRSDVVNTMAKPQLTRWIRQTRGQ